MINSEAETTPGRLLLAACELFARHGFRNTTTQMICKEAAANIAAVNYHFGGKEKLYLAVWEHVNKTAARRMAEVVDANAPTPEERLRRYIRMRVFNALSEGEIGWFGRLIQWEMSQPSPVHAEILERYLREVFERFGEMIRSVVGSDLDDAKTRLAGFCVHSPLIHLKEMVRSAGPNSNIGEKMARDPEVLIAALQAYAIGGLRELRRQHDEESSR